MPKTESGNIKDVLRQAKQIAREYYSLTGRPLGITGEVAEYEAAQILGLELAGVRQSGYDAVERTSRRATKIQIKGRRLPKDSKKSQRVPRIKLDKDWDVVMLVVLDLNYDACEIWEAKRPAIERALLAPGSVARNERGSLNVSQFKRIAERRWPQ